MIDAKQAVQEFWGKATCGEALYLPERDRDGFESQARARYALEPSIPDFAGFDLCGGKRVLEIGVGLGADHTRFAENGAELWGIDLTRRAIKATHQRLSLFGLRSHLGVMDAEALSFDDDFFDMVYSWGVLHHTPDTAKAIDEVYRVVKPDGEVRIMMYHKYSVIGYMLWVRYALMALQPFRSLSAIYAKHLESPGTKAFSIPEAYHLFRRFREITIRTELTHGDLLTSQAGQRHRGWLLSLARLIWPRPLIRKLLPGHGLFMLISCKK